MKGSRKIILGVVTALSLLSGAPAFADNGRGHRDYDDGRGRGNSQNTYIHRNYDHRDDRPIAYHDGRNPRRPEVIRIYDNNRIILNRYVEDRYRGSYSKGWSKHHRGYPPYYQTSRRYIVGYPLPREVVYDSVPYEVRSHLRPVPIGYQYVRVDNDVLLMNVATKQIIDAVTLLSAMGQR